MASPVGNSDSSAIYIIPASAIVGGSIGTASAKIFFRMFPNAHLPGTWGYIVENAVRNNTIKCCKIAGALGGAVIAALYVIGQHCESYGNLPAEIRWLANCE